MINKDKLNNGFKKLALIGVFFIFIGFILIFLGLPPKEALIEATFEGSGLKGGVRIDNLMVEVIFGGILSVAIGITIVLYGYGRYILPHKNQGKNKRS